MLESDPSMSQPESFLHRWSRLKLQPSGMNQLPLQPASAVDPTGSDESLSALFQPGVTRDIRQQVLRGLFMTDHYRVMDGLDVYVDDYSKPELLAAEMLDKIDHARGLLKLDEPEEVAAANTAGVKSLP